jgi:hypothetical protein
MSHSHPPSSLSSGLLSDTALLWFGWHLIRELLGTNNLKEGVVIAVGEQSPRKIEQREGRWDETKQRPRKGRTGGAPIGYSGRAALRREQCNGFDQGVAGQQLCKHGLARNNKWGCVFYVGRATPNAASGPMNSQSDTWHVFSVWSAPCNNRGAMFSVSGPCQEDIRRYGNGNWLHLISGVPSEHPCGQKKNQKT